MDRDAGSGRVPSRSERALEELAKAWLVRLVEGSELGEVEDLPVSWIAREAPLMIGEILGGLEGESAQGAIEREQTGAATSKVSGLRRGEGAPARIPRDLAALQGLLIEALRHEVPESSVGEFARTVQRLAERFGEVQSIAAEALVRERTGEARRDELTGLPGPADLHEWIRILLAEQRRYDHPFGTCLIDVEGRERISEAYGKAAGDRMLAAVATAVERQVRAADRVFRTATDELCAVCPHRNAVELRPLAERLAEVVDSSQSGEGPRLAVAIGIASCPEHGESGDELMQAAQEGVYLARADGVAFGIAGLDEGLFMQDS